MATTTSDILMGSNVAQAASAAAGPHAEASLNYLFNGVYQQAHYLTVGVFEKYGDPRVNNYHLMRTPWPTIAATLIYYWFVRIAGPRMMRNRKPYEILPLIRIYNLMMAAWNGFGFLTACHLVGYGSELIGCRPVDPFQRDEKTLNQIYYGWMFYTSRLVEFADTIFFTLRKKDSQVTSFHVFHHSSVPTATWFFLKFAPGGNSGIFPFINTIIHTIMYSYYFLATFPSMRPYLGWKKYLTQMQIVQFFIIIACCMQPMFIPGCKFPRALLMIMVGFSFVFIFLFVDFYLKSYRKKASGVKSKQQNELQQASNKKLQQQDEQAALMQKVLAINNDNNNSAMIRNRNDTTARATSTTTTTTTETTSKLTTSSLNNANGFAKKCQ